jgi:hypothetical membrane protein
MDAGTTCRNAPLPRLAGALWLLAGMTYLACEAAAAAAFPGYSYARNYISDLGVPYTALIDGRVIHSPLAWLMNFSGFILDGLLSAAAAVTTIIAVGARQRGGRAFLLLWIVHAAGSILVGTVHSGPREVAAGIGHFHVIGAAMAIIGGNAALLAAANLARKCGASSRYQVASLGLGLCGFFGPALLEATRVTGWALVPDGVSERASVYAITLWKIMTGLALLFAARRRPVPA